MKKMFSTLLIGTAIISYSLSVYANNSTSSKVGDLVETNSIVLEGEVGDIIEFNGVIFERLPDDSPAPAEIIGRASTESFKVTNFGGNQSLSKDIVLSGNYKYWKIWIRNTGSSNIIVKVDTASSSATVPGGQTWNYYSDSAWKTGTYGAHFTGGSGMYGEAAARIATSFAELDI